VLRSVVTVSEGVRIHYRKMGEGPPMIFLHDSPQTGHMWRKVMPDLPEALTAGREEIYLRWCFRAWAGNPAAIEEEAVQEYLRCFRQPGGMRAAFDDYRAGATLDLAHDGADRDRKVQAPTLIPCTA
jgi:hypothetical protein